MKQVRSFLYIFGWLFLFMGVKYRMNPELPRGIPSFVSVVPNPVSFQVPVGPPSERKQKLVTGRKGRFYYDSESDTDTKSNVESADNTKTEDEFTPGRATVTKGESTLKYKAPDNVWNKTDFSDHKPSGTTFIGSMFPPHGDSSSSDSEESPERINTTPYLKDFVLSKTPPPKPPRSQKREGGRRTKRSRKSRRQTKKRRVHKKK